MAIALVASTHIENTATSPAINTTGATLLVVLGINYNDVTAATSDSKGNTWHLLTKYGDGGPSGILWIAYAYDHGGSALSVGSGHTFTIVQGNYPSLAVLAFSGTDTTSAVYQASSDKGVYSSAGTTIQPGSVTPAAAGDLIVTGWCSGDSSNSNPTVDLSFVRDQVIYDGSSMDGAVAHLITTTTDAKNPTWTSGTNKVANIAVFKQGAGGGGDVSRPLTGVCG